MNRVLMIVVILIAGAANADGVEESTDQPTRAAEAKKAASRARRILIPRDGQAPPPGYHADLRIRPPLMLTGAGAFGVAYVASVVGAFLKAGTCPAARAVGGILVRSIIPIAELPGTCPEVDPWLGVLPLVGPMLVWQQAGGDLGMPILATAVQSVGLGLMIASLAIKQDVWVLDAASGTAVGITPNGVALRF